MRILIVRNNSNSHAVDASLLLATYLATQGIDYVLLDSVQLPGAGEELLDDSIVNVDMAVVLGGDGTILKTARQVGTSGVPVLGVNFGHLGFLANSSEDGVVSIVTDALAGDVVAEQRTNLRIDVVCEGEIDPWADNEFDACDCDGSIEGSLEGQLVSPVSRRSFFALNELALTRGANGRVVDFSLDISASHIADMRADGLVVATATGSTAYALSAGGPLVAPGFTGLVVVPLAPHTLHSRAIVTSPNDVVEIDLSGMADTREAALFVDGELLDFDKPVKRIYVQRGQESTVLLRHRHEGFYEHAAKAFF